MTDQEKVKAAVDIAKAVLYQTLSSYGGFDEDTRLLEKLLAQLSAEVSTYGAETALNSPFDHEIKAEEAA